MADMKKKSKREVTPIVDLVWDNLRKPDANGFVYTLVAFDPANVEHKLFLGKIRKYCDTEVKDCKRYPFWEETEKDTDKKTGRWLMKFSTKELKKITDIDEHELTFAPMMSRGTKLKATVGISNRNGYTNLWLNELQIVELIEYKPVGQQTPEAEAKKATFDDDMIPF